MQIKLWTDGAARGNPGPAGIGAVLVDPSGRRLAEIAEYIGESTNNYAEYRALIRGLEEARRLGASRVVVHLDSELVVRQLAGAYRVKSELLRPLFLEAKELLSRLEARVTHVPREENKRADELANEAIDSAQASGETFTGPPGGRAEEPSPGPTRSGAGRDAGNHCGQATLF